MKMIPVRVPVAVAREPVAAAVRVEMQVSEVAQVPEAVAAEVVAAADPAAAVRVEEPAEGPGADQGEAGAENSQAHLFAANQMI